MSEAALQKAVVSYLRVAIPHSLFWFTNNGTHSMRETVRLKALGLLKGVPDIAILSPKGMHFIELKVGKNKPTEAQSEFMSVARSLGADTAVCWTLDDVMLALRAWGLIR